MPGQYGNMHRSWVPMDKGGSQCGQRGRYVITRRKPLTRSPIKRRAPQFTSIGISANFDGQFTSHRDGQVLGNFGIHACFNPYNGCDHNCKGGWQLTHVPSGLSHWMMRCLTKTQARRLAKALTTGWDFTTEKDCMDRRADLSKQLVAAVREINA